MSAEARDWFFTTLKGALAAFLGAGLTALGQWAAGADLGEYAPWVAALVGLGVNAARKWVQETLLPPA